MARAAAELDTQVQQALATVLRLLVQSPEAISVDPLEEHDGICFRVTVDQKDLGKVIGRGGRTARSLRIILQAIGNEHGRRYLLNIPGDAPESEGR